MRDYEGNVVEEPSVEDFRRAEIILVQAELLNG